MNTENVSRVRALRDRLRHPVIDADGHLIEPAPLFNEYLQKVGGADMLERYNRELREHPTGSRGNPDAPHELLRVNLAGLELSRFPRWSHNRSALGAELIDHSSHQRRFRAHDSKVGGNAQVVRGRDVRGNLRCARIARRTQNLMTLECQPPGNRMLAAAASNDENFQYANFSVI